MLRYNKYIIGRLAGTMVLVCFSLTGIAWLTKSLQHIDYIVNRGLEITTFLYFSSLLLPSLMWIVVPISLFISILLVYNKLTLESELVALENAGITRFGLMKPALIFTVIVTIFTYIISLYLLPTSYREYKDQQSFIRSNYAPLLLQEGVFTPLVKGVTVYIRERDNNGLLHGIMVHDNRNENESTTSMARSGRIVKGASGPRFKLENGNRQSISKDGKEMSMLHFERYILDISLFISDKNLNYKRWREPEERYLHELFYPTDTPDRLISKLKARGHNRITWPLYNILLMLIALTVFITGEFNRYGQGKKIISVTIIATAIIVWGINLNGLVTKNMSLIPLMYLTVMIGIVVMSYIIFAEDRYIQKFFTNKRQKPMGGKANV